MRITKEKATETARRMLKPLNKRIDEHGYSIRRLVTEAALIKIPKEVLAVKSKFPEYFKSAYLSVTETGSNHWHSQTDDKIPYNYKSNAVDMSELDRTILGKLQRDRIKLKEEYDETFRYIENTLYSLRTLKKVTEVFPQALPFIPLDKETSQVAYPIESILNTLKKYEA